MDISDSMNLIITEEKEIIVIKIYVVLSFTIGNKLVLE